MGRHGKWLCTFCDRVLPKSDFGSFIQIDTGDTKGIKFHYEGQNGDDQMVEQDSCKKTTHGVVSCF